MNKFHKIPWRLPVPEDEKEEYLETWINKIPQ